VLLGLAAIALTTTSVPETRGHTLVELEQQVRDRYQLARTLPPEYR
jgi:hypothetical protein